MHNLKILIISTLFQGIIFTKRKSLHIIYSFRGQSNNYLFHIVIAITGNNIDIINSTYRCEYECFPLKICAPTEQLLFYVTNIGSNTTQSFNEKILNSMDLPITRELDLTKQLKIFIKNEEEENYLESVYVDEEELFNAEKITSLSFVETQKKLRALIAKINETEKSNLIRNIV